MALAWRSDAFKATLRTDLSSEQHKRALKIYGEEFYLLDTQREGNKRVFKVSGSKKSVYTLQLHDNGKLWCDCPDMKVHCRKHSCVCKHVVFLLVRVLKHYDSEFFRTLVLTPDHVTMLQERADNLAMGVDEQIMNMSLCEKYKTLKSDPFEYTKPISEDDECSICYDALAGAVVGCPTCNNGFHKKCMEKWLQSSIHQTCVYCRSSAWGTYFKQGSGAYSYVHL
jgi:hypothetical protein